MLVDYKEGDWFAVPLSGPGYGVGVIARAQPKYGGVLLGYFFGPGRVNVPSLGEVESLTPADAVLVRRFGHMKIRQGRWPIIGNRNEWSRTNWPMPVFIRRPSMGPAMLVTYADDDPNRMVSSAKTDNADSVSAVPEGLLGAALVATLLAKKIQGIG